MTTKSPSARPRRTHGLPAWALNSPEAADLAAPDACTPDAAPPAAPPPVRRLRRLTCCCCGDYAPAYGQWWNRDTGYGLCPRCVAWLESRADYDREEFQQCYGEEGIHWLREYPPE